VLLSASADGQHSAAESSDRLTTRHAHECWCTTQPV